jgi:hypothetical protein
MRRTWLPVLAAGVLALSASAGLVSSGASKAASASHPGLLHRAHGYLYYVNYSVDHGSIMRAAVPGSRPRQVVHIGDSAVRGLAVADGRLYWLAGVSTEQIRYVRLSGTPRVHVLARHLKTASALTASGGWLYWVDGTFVGRVRLGGSHVARRFLNLRAFNPLDAASDGHYLYLSNCSSHIGRVDLADRHFEPAFITLERNACAWGLAVGGQYLYWAEASGPPSYIGRAALTGTSPDDHWLNLHNLPGTFDVAGDRYDVFFDWQRKTGSSPGEDFEIGQARADGTGLRRYVWPGEGPFALTLSG